METTGNTVAQINNYGHVTGIKTQLENLIGHSAITSTFVPLDEKSSKLNINLNIILDAGKFDIAAEKQKIESRLSKTETQYKITESSEIPAHYKSRTAGMEKPVLLSVQVNELENSQKTVTRLSQAAANNKLEEMGIKQKPAGQKRD